MRIIIGADHGGYEMKEIVKTYLISKKYTIDDKGCYSTDSVDYPEIAKDVCDEVLKDKKNVGLLICGTGIGMSMTANKIKGIRAGLCHTEIEAQLTREHNNANVLTLGGRIIGSELAKVIAERFVTTNFSNEERHERRVRMMEEE